FAAYKGQGLDGKTVSVSTSIRDAEADLLKQSWKAFTDCTGIKVDYAGSSDFEAQLPIKVQGGNAPDIAFIPQPGLLANFAKQGALKPASAATKTEAEKNYSADWLK